jgi:hypothetical protein
VVIDSNGEFISLQRAGDVMCVVVCLFLSNLIEDCFFLSNLIEDSSILFVL